MSRSQPVFLILLTLFFCGCGGGGGPVEPANPSAPPGTGALKSGQSNISSGNAKTIKPLSAK